MHSRFDDVPGTSRSYVIDYGRGAESNWLQSIPIRLNQLLQKEPTTLLCPHEQSLLMKAFAETFKECVFHEFIYI